MYWAEGPAWSGWGNYLVWSDIPNNLQYRWLHEDGHVSVMRKPANNSNGNTFDLESRQISFEHLTHRVVRYEPDGSVTVLADSYGGKPLNAPNDGIVHPNGDLWFTDPGYGTLGDTSAVRAWCPPTAPLGIANREYATNEDKSQVLDPEKLGLSGTHTSPWRCASMRRSGCAARRRSSSRPRDDQGTASG